MRVSKKWVLVLCLVCGEVVTRVRAELASGARAVCSSCIKAVAENREWRNSNGEN